MQNSELILFLMGYELNGYADDADRADEHGL